MSTYKHRDRRDQADHGDFAVLHGEMLPPAPAAPSRRVSASELRDLFPDLFTTGYDEDEDDE